MILPNPISNFRFSPDGKLMITRYPGATAPDSGLSTEILSLPIENLDDLLARGCTHLQTYFNSHPDARDRLPICQDPTILEKQKKEERRK
jgi:hypothetical protein